MSGGLLPLKRKNRIHHYLQTGIECRTNRIIQMRKQVLITTKHRGVWYAEVEENVDLTATTLTNLKNCRMAIYWGTTKGLHELCETGPTNSSRISAPADIEVLHDVTAVFIVTPQAAEVWKR